MNHSLLTAQQEHEYAMAHRRAQRLREELKSRVTPKSLAGSDALIHFESSSSPLDAWSDDELWTKTGQTRANLQQILQNGAVARAALWDANVRLVVSIAQPWCRRAATTTSSSFAGNDQRPSLDEAMQEGLLGLAQAVDRFEPARQVRFSTYATFWITKYIRNCFQRSATIVRLPELHHTIRFQYNRYIRQQLASGATSVPPVAHVARQLGVRTERLSQVLRSTRPAISLDHARSRGNNGVYQTSLADLLPDTELATPQDLVELSFLRKTLEDALAQELPPLERDVLRMKLGLDGLARTSKQIAECGGPRLSVSDVRSAERRALKKLRSPEALSMYKLLAYVDF
jgi:RNA polymerase sigma factor (sigma-70 family)